jgi:lipid A 3-O-deacylase
MVGLRIALPTGLVFAALVGAVALHSATAAAQTIAAEPPKIVDELKIGGLAHDVGFLGRHVEGGADVNVELLFTSPDLLRYIGSPRPHIGADINTSGNTSDGYFGLTWGIMLIQNLFGVGDGIFANGSLGGAVHDGRLLTAPPDRKRLGSRILFRESLELGYQVNPVVSVSAILDHISNANLAPRNAGITSAGARIGFRF